MRLREGEHVAYAGYERGEGPAIGDPGQVISASDEGCHVAWESGGLTLESYHDVVPSEHQPNGQQRQASLDASPFEQRDLISFSARGVYDQTGGVGLINAMAEDGHLSTMAAAAEHAVGYLESKVRDDPSMARVLADLDTDEADAVVALAVRLLVEDVTGREDD